MKYFLKAPPINYRRREKKMSKESDKKLSIREILDLLERFFINPDSIEEFRPYERDMNSLLKQIVDESLPETIAEMAEDLAELHTSEREGVIAYLLGLVEQAKLDQEEVEYLLQIKEIFEVRLADEGEDAEVTAVAALRRILSGEKVSVLNGEEAKLNAVLKALRLPVDIGTLIVCLPRLEADKRAEFVGPLIGAINEFEECLKSEKNGFIEKTIWSMSIDTSKT